MRRYVWLGQSAPLVQLPQGRLHVQGQLESITRTYDPVCRLRRACARQIKSLGYVSSEWRPDVFSFGLHHTNVPSHLSAWCDVGSFLGILQHVPRD